MPWLPCSPHSSPGPRMMAETLGPLSSPEAAAHARRSESRPEGAQPAGTRVGGGEAGLPSRGRAVGAALSLPPHPVLCLSLSQVFSVIPASQHPCEDPPGGPHMQTKKPVSRQCL